jgi:plasmid stability protein
MAPLAIRNLPDEVVQRLEERARRHHRALEQEVLVILEQAARASTRLAPDQVLDRLRRLGLSTPGDATAMIREDRIDR